MNVIEIENLEKSYTDFRLGSLNLSLPSGSILGLIGENGAGKSTTIKLIMNTIHRDNGQIRVFGTDNQSKEFVSLKNQIGVVLDEAYYPEVLNARQAGKILRHTYENWDQKAFDGYLSLFELPLKKPFKDYSRGMKMKFSIAVALSHHAKLLILDEATSGLDPLIRDEILDIFNDFTREEDHSILISSHIVSDLEKICDYVAFLHQGKLLLFEEKDRLLEDYALVHLSHEQLKALPADSIIGQKEGKYEAEVLVKRDRLPAGLTPEYTSLEEIILFWAKGGSNE